MLLALILACPNLKRLSIWGARSLSPEIIEVIGQTTPITHLALSGFCNRTRIQQTAQDTLSVSVLEMVQRLGTNLRELTLLGAPSAIDAARMAAACCNNLEAMTF